jgi:dihydroorotate dehydrogenase (NAD+) catalytic subunit
MLNGIGIQNPGIDVWSEQMQTRIESLGVSVWGSAVAGDVTGFARVARSLADSGVDAVEVNLSCPNLDDGVMFSFDPSRSAAVVDSVRDAVPIPVGAKLSPNTPEIVEVASAVRDAGADFVVLTNTAFGAGIDLAGRKPLLSGGVGGYSGPGLKPISMRCVLEVSRALPDLPIVGCGGVSNGRDMLEYLMAGASAVAAGTIHLAEPRAGVRMMRELSSELERLGFESAGDAVGVAVDR